MKILQATKCEDLIKIGGGNAHVYIYGAKTIAQRACLYLERHGINVDAFLVSARYKNPEMVGHHPVWRIEEHAQEPFDVVILAVSRMKAARSILKDFQQYHIHTVAVILRPMYDSFPLVDIRTDRCKIAADAFVAETAEIFADETSEIVIEEGAFISSRAVILASEHSRIHIGKGAMIGDETCLIANTGSCLDIGANARLEFRGDVFLESKSTVTFGEGTSVEHHFYFSIVRCEIHFGKDNMLSNHVYIMGGGHGLFDEETKQDLLNRKPIRTGNHVWIGMRATLLPGADIGEGSIVGAAAVVAKFFPQHCTIAGNPARILHEGMSWHR